MGLEKGKFKLMKFDVVEFYPSITETLLRSAIKFAEKHVDITAEEINIIHNSCESVLHSNGEVWVKNKKCKNALFDVAMGSYSGAETCELIGLYMLHGLSKIFGKGMVGLYRDDGLAAFPVQSGFKTEKLKASVHRFVKGVGLKVTIEAPLTSTDFLDVQLDIDSQSFAPYHKPNSRIKYVNANSNHPSTITKSVPKIINDRLNKRSSSQKEFDEHKGDYERALSEAGYSAKLSYSKEKTEEKKRKRKRNIMWFNPPFCKSVRTNIGRKFIGLIKRHFNEQNPLKRLFNKNNMRVSYSCVDNMERIIKKHNAKILNEGKEIKEESCNCKRKDECPFQKQGESCQATNVVYKAEIKTETECKYYIGLSEPKFKFRFNNHTSSFSLDSRAKPTLLAEHVRNLKRANVNHTIEWSIIKRAKAARNGDAVCRLCLKEATEIVFADKNCINKRNEVMNTCRHKRKFLLKHLKAEPD